MAKDTIHFLILGGTIDSSYDGKIDTVVPNKKSGVPEYIESLKLDKKVAVLHNYLIDFVFLVVLRVYPKITT